MPRNIRFLVAASAVALFSFGLLAPAALLAQSDDQDDRSTESDDATELAPVTVTARPSRLPANLDTFPGSVTRIGRPAIEDYTDFENDAGGLLTLLVPGMGEAAPASASNFEQTIRGRKATVLIDGVPISTPLRDGRHDVRVLSLTALDSVEIIRGASALYGNGGAGGVINYVTRRPAASGVEFATEAGTEVSLTHPGDSLAPYFHQAVSGRDGNVDFIADAYVQRTNSFFDADGDRIRPSPQGQGGIADSSIVNLFGKVGYTQGAQRFEASILYYDKEQDTDFNEIILGDPAAGIKTRVAEAPQPDGAVNPSDENLVVNASWAHADVFGSSVRVQGYYQTLQNIFDYFPGFFPGGGQSTVESDKYGGRLDITTPLRFAGESRGEILWGADIRTDETAQPLVDGRIWAPGIEQDSLAGFAQARLELTDRLQFSGGLRHEQIDVSFPSFTALFSGDTVPAGETDYDSTTFNAGFSYELSEPLVAFVSYSEGFSVAEVGRILRQAGEFTDFSVAQLEAAEVQNYEAGLRWQQPGYSASIAGFRTESDLGTTITTDLRIARQAEETFGIEATFDGRVTDRLRVSGSVSWIDGNRDADGDGSLERPLPSNVVPPIKIVGIVDYAITPTLTARIQSRYSGERDEFDRVLAFGENPIDAYTVVDASLNADLGRYGRVSLAVNNLLNNDYFPLASQLFACCADRFTQAPGARARLSWSVRY
ncbi:MAG: TonB-dependent receptor [Candidatus Wenzhouxiangella sp. M2_3B_020]